MRFRGTHRARPTATTILASALAVALVLGSATVYTWQRWHTPDRPSGSTVDMLNAFGADRVVAADVGHPEVSGAWRVTSGSLLARDGMLCTGAPDAGPPDPAAGLTGNAVLRAVSRRSFTDADVHISLRISALLSTSRTPEQDWDGVHVFLRYQNPDSLYVADLGRRDGQLTIKRKRAASTETGGSYQTLASTHLARSDGWRNFDVRISSDGAATRITLLLESLGSS